MRTPEVAGDSAVAAQHAAEDRYRRLLDGSLVPVWVHDGRSVLYANPAAVRAMGAESAAEIVGRRVGDIVHPVSLPGVRERMAALTGDGDVTVPADVVMLRVDGTEFVAPSVATVRMGRGPTTYEVVFRDPGLFGRSAAVGPRAIDAVITTSRHGIVTGWGADAGSLYGHATHEVIGMPIERALGVPFDPAAMARAGMSRRATHFDAEGNALSVRVVVIRTADGFAVVCSHATSQRGEPDLYDVLDLLHDGVVIVGSDGTFEYSNRAARRILGDDVADLAGKHHSDQAVDFPLYDEQGRQIVGKDHPLGWILKTGLSVGGVVVGVDRADGSRFWVTGNGCLVDPDDPEHSAVVVSFTDITEHYDARQRLRHDATHDWLTGLPNRGHALEQAGRALGAAGAERLSAVLYIDLDRLKTINDNHGHTTGDAVIQVAAQRMSSAMRAQDLIARIGGDEFVVLLRGPVRNPELDDIAERVHRVLDDDIVLGPLTLRIGASIGVTTVAEGDRRSLAEVLRDADTAMYRAKSRGRAGTARVEPGGAD